MPATFLRGRESLSAISLAVASMNAPADMTEPETCALMAIDESSEPSRFRTDAARALNAAICAWVSEKYLRSKIPEIIVCIDNYSCLDGGYPIPFEFSGVL